VEQAWIDRVQDQADKAQDKLDLELFQHKQNSIKEKIRMGHNDLGRHHHMVGNLNEALKCFVRTRDYGTNVRHTEEMCLNVIRVAIEMRNYSHVVNYVNKAEQALDSPADPSVLVKLRVANGLAHLDGGRYRQAALKFCAMKVEVGKENNQAQHRNVHPDELGFTEVLSAQDVAIYGGICALATFERQELAAKVVDEPAFKQFLELAPEMRELVSDFYGSRYASSLAHMAKLKGDLLLDVYMAPHVAKLYGMIRSRALVQYFTPFASVRMPLMADAFSTTVPELQKELSELIMKKEIKARIDAHNQILHVRTAEQEASSFEKALVAGVEYARQTAALILRLELIRHDLAIKVPRTHAPPRGDRDDD
jgi:COP9 signalosome complex subunit 1